MDDQNNSKFNTNNGSQPSDAKFTKVRTKNWQQVYSDEYSLMRGYDRTKQPSGAAVDTPESVRELLEKAFADPETAAETSLEYYASNPIYAQILNYLSNMFSWYYKVMPHRVYTASKAKARKPINEEDYGRIYNLMLEIVEGINIETKFPQLLLLLFQKGAVYFTTDLNEETYSIETILLPNKYCRKVGMTQFGTAIIQFDFSYFDSLGLGADQLKQTFASFPKEISKKYNIYKKNTQKRWQVLDSRFSTALVLNDQLIPTYLYALSGILAFEQYQGNELNRSGNLLRYLVVHQLPTYQDKLLLDMDEVADIHRSIANVITKDNDNAHVITTFGNAHVETIAESDTTLADALAKAYAAVFNDAGFNSAIFTADSVQSLAYSILRDKNYVWYFVKSLAQFYTIAVNNYFDFKNYQADIEILPISPYTYNEDIERYRSNATLGINKIDLIIASGIKQKHIQDNFALEDYLHLERIKPLATSYTQAGETGSDTTSTDADADNEIEPSTSDETASEESIATDE